MCSQLSPSSFSSALTWSPIWNKSSSANQHSCYSWQSCIRSDSSCLGQSWRHCPAAVRCVSVRTCRMRAGDCRAPNITHSIMESWRRTWSTWTSAQIRKIALRYYMLKMLSWLMTCWKWLFIALVRLLQTVSAETRHSSLCFRCCPVEGRVLLLNLCSMWWKPAQQKHIRQHPSGNKLI